MTFALSFAAYLAAALILAFRYHTFPEDAVSRMANGFYILYSNDPHLAAIGFVWNPLQSMADAVVLLFRALWPALASHDMGGSIVSVTAMAGAAFQLNATLREWKCPSIARILLTVAFAANPMVLYYGANGMSEGLYLFTLLATTRYLLRWVRDQDLRSLVYAGTALAFCYLDRNEAFGAAALGTLVVLGVSYLRELWTPEGHAGSGTTRSRVMTALVDGTIFVLPFTVTASGWAITSWVITGQPFAQFTSIYGNSSQETFLAHKHLHARIAYEIHAVGALAPTLVVVVLLACLLALRRRNPASLAVIAIVGGALLFDVGGYLTNTIENFLRYFITAIPLCILLVGSLFDRSHGWLASNPNRTTRSSGYSVKPLATLVATVASATLVLPSLVTTSVGMFNPNVGVQEYSLLGVVFHRPLNANDLAVKASYPDIEAISTYLTGLKLPNGSIIIDNFTSCVPDIITNIQNPKVFVIPNDRDFKPTLADPLTFHAHYILEANPKDAPITAVNLAYPTLWATGAGFTKLAHQLPSRGDCPQFRLFRVVSHPE